MKLAALDALWFLTRGTAAITSPAQVIDHQVRHRRGLRCMDLFVRFCVFRLLGGELDAARAQNSLAAISVDGGSLDVPGDLIIVETQLTFHWNIRPSASVARQFEQSDTVVKPIKLIEVVIIAVCDSAVEVFAERNVLKDASRMFVGTSVIKRS